MKNTEKNGFLTISFIRPSMFGIQAKDALYPLVFAIVKAITPEDVKINFYDERIEKIPENIEADVVAMTVETFSAKRAYILAKKYRAQGKKVIMGGFHPTACPDEVLEFADSIVIGEIENTWPEVIFDLRENKLKRKYENCNPVDLSTVKMDYSVFKGKKYNPIGLVQFSRGCKFACEFCSVHAFYKNSVRLKSIDTIVEEIKNINEKFVFFIDDNLFSDEKRAENLFKALIPLKKKWCCQISIDIAKDKKLLNLMRKSGCFMVIIGFESLNKQNLIQMKKGVNIKNNDYDSLIKNINDASIMIYGTFVIGYDYDTKNTAEELMKFALKHKFAIANFNPLMPMPGTALFERLKKENRLIYEKWWLDDSYSYGNAMLKPCGMTPSDLVESCKSARFKFNSYPNILYRLFNLKSTCKSFKNIIFFLIANLVSHAEIYLKQGRKLGGV